MNLDNPANEEISESIGVTASDNLSDCGHSLGHSLLASLNPPSRLADSVVLS